MHSNQTLPANPDIERAILGTLVMEPHRLYEVEPSLGPEQFSLDANRRIYAAMLSLSGRGVAIDPLAIIEELGKRGEIQHVGGHAYLSDLTTGVLLGRDLTHHVATLRDKSNRRYLIAACQSLTERITDPTENTTDCVASMEDALLRVQTASTRKLSYTAKEIMPDVLNEIYSLRNRADDVIGLTTGLVSLDRTTTGIRPDEYWVVGALPSRGKTLLGIQMAAANLKRDIPTLIFSHEMSRNQLLKRMLPWESGVSPNAIRDPRYMSNADYEAIESAAVAMSKWPLFVDDVENLSASEIAASAKMHIRRHGVRLIIVDYLQLLYAPGKELRERVSNASDALRRIPKQERVPVVALSQLARPKDGNENSRPALIHLRESGAIEGHAHVVLLLYRPKDEKGRWSGEDEIIIAKQREGHVGYENVTLSPQRVKFVERAA